MIRYSIHVCFLIVFVALVSGCANRIPKEALELRPESLALRQMQTRQFETKEESQLLQASSAVLQDMGFNIDEVEMRLGVVVGSKSREASGTGEKIALTILAVLANTPPTWDSVQNIRASLVSRPSEPGRVNLRVTFQRIIWNNHNQITKIESLEDATLYQEFFDKLSKSVFLQAHNI